MLLLGIKMALYWYLSVLEGRDAEIGVVHRTAMLEDGLINPPVDSWSGLHPLGKRGNGLARFS